jgi:uncharacterized protein YbjT (DUF2867 family)
MHILLTGSTGFIGNTLQTALQAAGHTVHGGVSPRSRTLLPGQVPMDFAHDTTAAAWLPRLAGIDAVVNAVGVLRDSSTNPMQALHTDTPLALFAACAESGVRRVVHLSALGVESGVAVPYFSTRIAAEQALSRLPCPALCLRPSVIYGADGASAQLFRQLAKLPLHALAMGGEQTLQPVHIDDLGAAVVNWLANPDAVSLTVAAVGAEPTTMRGMLDSYRAQFQLRPAYHLTLPRWLVRIMASLGDYAPNSPLCSDTFAMLAAGNTADASDFARLLQRSPRSFRTFIAHES